MISVPNANEILNILSGSGARFFEIFAEHSVRRQGLIDTNKIENLYIGVDTGVGLRIIKGQRTAYAYINSFDIHLLRHVAKQLTAAFKDKNPKADANFRFLSDRVHGTSKDMSTKYDVDKKIDILQRLDNAARSYSRLINQVAARYDDCEQRVWIANSEGLAAEDVRNRSRYTIDVMAQKYGATQTGHESSATTDPWEDLKQQDVDKLSRAAAGRAVKMINAKPAPAGKMMVVLSGKAGGTMIHEACGHSLEADFVYKKTSSFAECLNQQVASPLITVVDDGCLTRQFGSMTIDDEGTGTRKNILIQNGILETFMTDRLYAYLLGLPLSGNARRESYRNKPVPRMTNTYIAPGASRPEDIIASVEQGLFVIKMQGGQVNPVSGDFVFEITEGYLIKNGLIKEAVRGAILSGNGPQVLHKIDMVAGDLSFRDGMCGKEDEVPVGHGQPTIRIPEILIGGHAL